MGRFIHGASICFLLVLQMIQTSTVSAASYYVHAAVGNNSNSGLDPDNAFADLWYAMKQLSPGDTLYIRSGVYRDMNILSADKYNNGTETLPITVRPYLNEAPVISFSEGFVIKDISWWVFEDLLFQNSSEIKLGNRDSNIIPASAQCTSYAEDITIRRNRFQHGDRNGITITCGRRIRIEDNLFDNLRSRIAGQDRHGVSFHYYAEDIGVSGNLFTDIGADGIHFLNEEGAWYGNIYITGNEFQTLHPYTYRDLNGDVVPAGLRPFESVGENAIDIKQGPGPIHISGNYIHGFRPTLDTQDASGANGVGIIIHNSASGITVSRNYFHDNVMHLVVQQDSGSSGNYPPVDVTIKNNIFSDAVNPGPIFEGSYSRVTALRINNVSDVNIFNNTFRQTVDDQGELLFLANITNVSLLNNVFSNGRVLTQYELAGENTGDFSVSANNNAWSEITGTINALILGNNDIISADLMIDWFSWTPLEGSPLIDTGADTGVVEDIHGAPLSGSGPDIGAGEYQIDQPGEVSLLAELSIRQAGIPVRIAYPDRGNVEISVNVNDPALGATHSYDWSQSDNSIVVISGNGGPVLNVDPAGMTPGVYRAHVIVTNDTQLPQSVETEILFEIGTSAPELDDNSDSDRDGISDLNEGAGDRDQDGIPDYLDAIDDTSLLQGIDGVNDRYLLATDPGLSLRLGSIAMAAGSLSAGISMQTIIDSGQAGSAGDSLSYAGGIYDFEITGLQRAGQSVRIVLPQQAAIPSIARFRKYHPLFGWQDFTVNSFNSVASARGQDGLCPPPGDSAYRPGLTAGDFCIELTLEDGGPNDTDGVRNGVIQDPGGVAGIASAGDSSTSNTDDSLTDIVGGCTLGPRRAVDPSLLLLLIASALGIRKHRSRRWQ